jgi:hypothetical protein
MNFNTTDSTMHSQTYVECVVKRFDSNKSRGNTLLFEMAICVLNLITDAY